ncbi:MAG: Qat anti-phage system TatD family nuclease QatD [Candidatus Thiodiazotropha endolucinida]
MTLRDRSQGYDFHCHIDLYPDPQAIISACEQERITVMAVTTTPKAWPQNRKWVAQSNFVHAAVGLHPELVGERYQEITLLERYIDESPLIGEVGLDGSPKFRDSWEKQKEVFSRVLRRAQAIGGRVVSIHSRRAAKEVVAMIREITTPDRVLCILHWFSGTKSIGLQAASAGCYFSINSEMLNSKQGADIVRALPIDRLLTETDGPFTGLANRSQMPCDVLSLPEHMAELLGVSTGQIADAINRNAEQVLKMAAVSYS